VDFLVFSSRRSFGEIELFGLNCRQKLIVFKILLLTTLFASSSHSEVRPVTYVIKMFTYRRTYRVQCSAVIYIGLGLANICCPGSVILELYCEH